jgi:hypothetical protein
MAAMTLDDLTGQLRHMHGGKLRCIVLYGSAAANEQLERQSDLNVLVLVDTIDPAQLEALGQTARAWEEAGNPPPLELTVSEWQRSADIFPMEYADILERHRVLFGELPTQGVQVSLGDLRRQTEHEAMGKVLRLRQGIMRAGTDVKQQTDLLRASHSTLMVIFRAAVRTTGVRAPSDREALISQTAQLAGFDAAPFHRVHAIVRGGPEPKGKEAEHLLFSTLAGMERLTAWLDAHVAAH